MNKSAKSQIRPFLRKQAAFSITLLMLLSGMFAVTVYAWFKWTVPVADTGFNTGKLNQTLELYYWEKGAEEWRQVYGAGGMQASFYPKLGEITNIASLPAGEDALDAYLKIRMADAQAAYDYNYTAYAKEITIRIYPDDAGLSEEMALNYYKEDLPFACLDYCFAAENADGINPMTGLFGGTTPVHLSAPGQSLTDGGRVASGEWLYVKLEPRLGELQNIFRSVPGEYMPYEIEFIFTVEGETRVGDY